ncbi:hypothetical protein GLW08_21405 [Pontibacillus yanchengensis]|uniref:Uncharacterized protein n=2 Tax=Pontibacillus yanchengensis TaxID=462910 RepID=A0ACC7VMK2_9BACI|nr:hypothetical protein [Pontibacillus yanchengensis]MYL35442.1 hypothetical protein [Pontibacillus yanchengensis]MYL55861.1 hypothetical protein [Pontibacillus yanchengensis]
MPSTVTKNNHRQKVAENVIAMLIYSLEEENPFMTCDESGNGSLEVLLSHRGEHSTRVHHVAQMEKDEDGFMKAKKLPKEPNIPNLIFAIENISFVINQYISSRTEIAGKLIFHFENGVYVKYESESLLKMNDIKTKIMSIKEMVNNGMYDEA